MADEQEDQFPIGEIIELIPEKCAALVKSRVTISTTSGGGSSTAQTTSSVEEKILPARILVRGTKRMQEFFSYSVGEKVILMANGRGTTTNAAVGQAARDYDGEWSQYLDEYENFMARECVILGAFYDEPYNLPCQYDEVAMIKFKDGSSVTYNFEDKELELDFKGDVTINGRGIYLNS